MTPRELGDLEELRNLKPRYWRYVDTRQWDRLRALFTDDAGFDGVVSGAVQVDAWVAALARTSDRLITVHQGHAPELQLVSADQARGIWPFFDYLDWSACDPVEVSSDLRQYPDQWGLVGYGHYEEEYRRTRDGWRISFMRLTRLRVDALTGERPGPVRTGARLSQDWVGRHD